MAPVSRPHVRCRWRGRVACQGHRDSLGPLRHSAHFGADHPSLFYAYGYAQMEAHSELLLRLYAQARGRGAEFYGEPYLDADRWVRTNGDSRAREGVGGAAEPGVRSAARRVRRRPEWLGRRAPGRPERGGQGGAAGARRGCATRIACASSTTTGSSIPPSSTTRLRRAERRGPRLERMGDRAVVLRVGQGDAAEQLASGVGRHAHLLRGAAHGARRQRPTARSGSAFRCSGSASTTIWAGRRRPTTRTNRICIA